MRKSGGGKMQAAGQKRAPANERRRVKAAATQDADVAVLTRETERLRAELDEERKRVKKLEDANNRVREKLSVAIESVKSILARQG